MVFESLCRGGQEVPFQGDGVSELGFGEGDCEDGFVRGADGAGVEEDLIAIWAGALASSFCRSVERDM